MLQTQSLFDAIAAPSALTLIRSNVTLSDLSVPDSFPSAVPEAPDSFDFFLPRESFRSGISSAAFRMIAVRLPRTFKAAFSYASAFFVIIQKFFIVEK